MRDLVDGKSIHCELAGAKTFGRLVGTSYLNDKTDLVPLLALCAEVKGA